MASSAAARGRLTFGQLAPLVRVQRRIGLGRDLELWLEQGVERPRLEKTAEAELEALGSRP